MSLAYLSPHARDWRSEEVIAEWDGVLRVVEDQAQLEVTTRGFRQFPQPSEVACVNRGSSLDLKAHDDSALTLHNDVHLILVLVSIVVKPTSFVKPRRLLHDFREEERLKQWAKDRTVFGDALLGRPYGDREQA